MINVMLFHKTLKFLAIKFTTCKINLKLKSIITAVFDISLFSKQQTVKFH